MKLNNVAVYLQVTNDLAHSRLWLFRHKAPMKKRINKVTAFELFG